ncbi:hypothetical protein PIB30_077069 [Stylosanthes scabra]|uniref:Uncharacterized protein n=1 Tax=Stylosanthes scabra TaxID=79078 RepID=A0ABU6TQH4_9FABA|nr:hypothetical protein [Stylosanthes scabra]
MKCTSLNVLRSLYKIRFRIFFFYNDDADSGNVVAEKNEEEEEKLHEREDGARVFSRSFGDNGLRMLGCLTWDDTHGQYHWNYDAFLYSFPNRRSCYSRRRRNTPILFHVIGDSGVSGSDFDDDEEALVHHHALFIRMVGLHQSVIDLVRIARLVLSTRWQRRFLGKGSVIKVDRGFWMITH